MGNQQTQGLTAEEIISRDIKSLDWETKQKLSSSHIKYNLRVVIKGDRNTGKSCLFRRLQGLSFVEEYNPTPEIQVANIHWNYKNSDDIIKVEIWDVVDKAKKKRKEGSLKLAEEDDSDDEVPQLPNVDSSTKGSFTVQRLDASAIDVYKGTHCVILIIDPTKKWTFEYAQREITNIPRETDVLLLVNYRDMGDYRVVSEKDIKEWVKFQDHPSLKCLEASMKNSYGLKSVITFFNLPFLKLQRSYIEQQLKQNSEEIAGVEHEIQLISKEQNYDFYVKWLEQTKKAKLKSSGTSTSGPAPASTASPTIVTPHHSNNSPVINNVTSTTNNLSTGIPARKGSVGNAPIGVGSNVTANTSSSKLPVRNSLPVDNAAVTKDSNNAVNTVTNNPTASNAAANAPSTGFFARVIGRFGRTDSSSNVVTDDSKKVVEDLKSMAATKKSATQSIDDFSAGQLDDDFLGGGSTTATNTNAPTKSKSKAPIPKSEENDDDDDEDSSNPMVAKDEDLDFEVMSVSPSTKRAPTPSNTTSPPTKKENTPTVTPKINNTNIANNATTSPPSRDKETKATPSIKVATAETKKPTVTSNTVPSPSSKTFSTAASKMPPVSRQEEEESDEDDSRGNPLVLNTEDDDDDAAFSNVKTKKEQNLPVKKEATKPAPVVATPILSKDDDDDDSQANPLVLQSEDMPDDDSFWDSNSNSVPAVAPIETSAPIKATSKVGSPVAPIKQQSNVVVSTSGNSDDEDNPNPLVSRNDYEEWDTNNSSSNVNADFESIQDADDDPWKEQDESTVTTTTAKPKKATKTTTKKTKKKTTAKKDGTTTGTKTKKTKTKTKQQQPANEDATEENEDSWI